MSEIDQDIKIIKDSIVNLTKRIDTLEQSTPKRHTHSTTACFEDALAVAVDIIKSEEIQNQYTRGRLRQMVQIVQSGREGPYSYDPERCAGKRLLNDNSPDPVQFEESELGRP